MKYLTLISSILICMQTLANDLIPRQELFDMKGKSGIVLSADGATVFYQNLPEGSNSIIAYDLETGNENEIEFPSRLVMLEPYKAKSVLVILRNESGEELRLLNGELSDNLLDFKANRIRPVKIVASGAILSITAKEEDKNGFYLLNEENELNKILGFDGFNEVFFDNNANPIIAQRPEPGAGYSIYLRKKDEWEELLKLPWGPGMFLGGFQKVIAVSNDGKRIYFTDNRAHDKNHLTQYNTETKTFKIVATPGEADIIPFGTLLNKDNEPAIVVSVFAKTIYHIVDESYQVDFEVMSKEIEKDISFASASANGEKILLREFTGNVQHYYLYDRNNKSLKKLFSDRPHLEQYELSDRIAHSFQTSDNLHLPMHVYLPPGSDTNNDGIPDKPLPTVIYVHGGPWVGIIHFNSWMHQRCYQLLANRGYAVIVAEFRGASGLGKEVYEKSRKTWGTDMTRDKAELAQWAIEKGISAESKIGIWGWSYGGYAALAGLAYYPDLYACGISMYGPSNLIPTPDCIGYQQPFWEEMVGNPETERALLEEQSPINYLENFKAPILLTTGSLDDRVPQAPIDTMANRLHRLNKEVSYFYYPEEGHDYVQKSSWVSFWAFAEAFLKDNLDGEAEPIKNDTVDANFEMVYPLKLK